MPIRTDIPQIAALCLSIFPIVNEKVEEAEQEVQTNALYDRMDAELGARCREVIAAMDTCECMEMAHLHHGQFLIWSNTYWTNLSTDEERAMYEKMFNEYLPAIDSVFKSKPQIYNFPPSRQQELQNEYAALAMELYK